MWIAILAVMVPPPSEATLAEYSKPEPTFPAAAIQYKTSCGKTIGIVPEEPINQTIYRTETRTTWVSTCGMPCSVHVAPVNKTVRIPVGEEPLNRPTPLAKIEDALQQIQLSESDVLYDLGCGDGRVCILAAAMGARAVGIDQRQEAIDLAERNAALNNVSEDVNWFAYDVFNCTFSRPTVIFTFFLDTKMEQLRRTIEAESPASLRVCVSYLHEWPGVENERVGDFFIWRPVRKKPVRTARFPGEEYRAPIPDTCVGGT